MDPLVVLIAGSFDGQAPTLAASLEAAGHQVVQAEDVMAAVQACVEHPVDAVLADTGLGDGGKGLLSHLKAESGPRHVPLVFLSAAEPDRVRLLAEGADEVFPQLPSHSEVLARLERHAQMRRRIDELLQANDNLRALAITDGLTQVANHRYFQERLKEEYRRAQRYDDPLSLIMLDVDHFKEVNDSYGHPLGDEVLKAIAATIKHAVRETDFVARYGGEEFVMLLPQTHLAGALTVAERVSVDVRALRFGPGKVLTVSASFGVSSFPGRAVTSPEALVKTADEAMYRAKREGRDRISLYHVPMTPLGAPPTS